MFKNEKCIYKARPIFLVPSRDMGKIELFNEHFYFKIDYFDRQKYQQGIGSEEPYNVDKTFRVMTIMLASEY
ncbi:MAG: DUF3768 domain-containing protein [Cyanobacteria bacterium P01_H01_bin.150]